MYNMKTGTTFSWKKNGLTSKKRGKKFSFSIQSFILSINSIVQFIKSYL